MEINIDKLLKKYYKTYLLGKKSLSSNKEKALDYIKESLLMLDDLKKNHSNEINKYSNILTETELESCKIINECIEYYLDTEIPLNDEIDYVKLFKLVEKGNIDEIKKYNINQINFKKLYNNQTLLHYAKISILKLVLEKNRNSLFQYANN